MISDLNIQIVQKNKKIEYLLTIINWYKKVTGISYEENFDLSDFENGLNNNDNYGNENALNQKIMKLKETIVNLTEKKNYYKSKVPLNLQYKIFLVQSSERKIEICLR